MGHQQKQPNAVQVLFARFFEREIQIWYGNARLSTLFWRDGVLTSFILILLYATTIYLHQLVAEQLLLVFVVVYTVWILVSIWRCSLATGTVWGVFARFLVIAWAANVALVLLFRQLELLILFADSLGKNIN
ncbi:hypothetical protein ACEWPM_005770 [Roseovarius sp. S4756]|uniref:hypothetical protein n=1 Tax=Roseovarius maritimus TaxID=3342637 RepID=UPI003728708B